MPIESRALGVTAMMRHASVLMVVGSMVVLCACTVTVRSGEASSRVVNLSIDGYRFVPDHLVVSRGETVRFVISNPTDLAHEVAIGTVAEQAADEAAHQSAKPMEQAGVSTHFGYSQYIPAFSTVDFTYHFSGDAEVMLGCHLPGHWAKGMKADITVTGS